jgi:hypothetical protein
MAGAGTAAARILTALAALAAAAGAQSEGLERESAREAPAAVGEISDARLADPVAREWLVRELASDALHNFDRLAELVASDEPQRALVAFDALERSLRATPTRDVSIRSAFVLAFAPRDERVDVQLARLRALSAVRRGMKVIGCFALPDDPTVEAATHPYSSSRAPLVRAEAAWCARSEGEAQKALADLLVLLVDSDERVASAANGAFAVRVADDALPANALSEAWQVLAEAPLETRAEFLLALEAARCPAGALRELEVAAANSEPLFRGAVQALRFCAGERGDAKAVLEAWNAPEFEASGLAPLFERAARSARVVGSDLGARAFELYERSTTESPDTRALELALEALGLRETAALALASPQLDEARKLAVFERFRGRSIEWTAAELAPWLDPRARSTALRLEVVEWLGAAVLDTSASELQALLVHALEDPDLEVARAAFWGLCDVDDLSKWGNALHAAWGRFEEPLRLELVARLPRQRPLPEFREDWLRLGERGGEVQGAVLELVSAFAPDEELAAAVERWIDETLARWGDGHSVREDELRLAGLARALGKLAPERSVARLEALARWASGRSDEVGKVTLFALGQSSAGRATLAYWLAPDAPSRLRIEAALMLAPHGDAKAVGSLLGDFARSDLQLKGRAVDVFAALDDERARAFLRDLARDEHAELQLRLRALDTLARRTPPETKALAEATRDANPELSFAAWRSFAAVGGERGAAALAERLVELGAERRGAPGPDAALRVAERGELLRAAAAIGLFDERVVAEWRALLDLQASGDLRERFVDDREPRPEFSYGAELEFARALARVRRLGPALSGANPAAQGGDLWRRWDASVLEALGAGACDEGELETGRELLAASYIALLGEPDGEARGARAFELQRRLLLAAEQARDWPACADLAERLLDDVRARRVSSRRFERFFGGFDPAARVDGVARLASALHQARARAALELGDLEGARKQREKAAQHAARSSAAAAALARLDEELSARSGAGK